MKKTIDEHNFIEEFRAYGRLNEFGYDGLRALFEMLEEYEEDTGEEIELDVIGLCCEFTRYNSAVEACEETGVEFEKTGGEEAAMEALRSQTLAWPFEGGIIVQNF